MGREIHPDMHILQDAQKVAYGGSGIEGIRAGWANYTRSLAQPHPPHLIVTDAEVPVPGHPVSGRIYRHPKPSGARAIYMHGGGFMKGDLDSSDPIAWDFCDQTGATVISVDYRLTPEHPFPVAFDDCYGVLGWAAANGAELGLDPARIGLVGDSAGGQLAAGLCLAARDRGGPSVKAPAVIYTVIGNDMEGGSYDENATGLGLANRGPSRRRQHRHRCAAAGRATHSRLEPASGGGQPRRRQLGRPGRACAEAGSNRYEDGGGCGPRHGRRLLA